MLSDSFIPEEIIREVTGLLSHLTTDELKSVLNDDARLDELLKDVKQGQTSDRETEKEMLLASNRSLAEYNLSMEPTLLSYKNDIIRYSEDGEEWYNKVSAKYEKLLELLGQHKLDAKLSVLQLATAEIEEESEKIAETFLNGESDIEDFLEQFISRRKTMHLNKVKTDKMSEMIRQRGNIESRGNHDVWNHNSQISHFNMNGLP